MTAAHCTSSALRGGTQGAFMRVMFGMVICVIALLRVQTATADDSYYVTVNFKSTTDTTESQVVNNTDDVINHNTGDTVFVSLTAVFPDKMMVGLATGPMNGANQMTCSGAVNTTNVTCTSSSGVKYISGLIGTVYDYTGAVTSMSIQVNNIPYAKTRITDINAGMVPGFISAEAKQPLSYTTIILATGSSATSDQVGNANSFPTNLVYIGLKAAFLNVQAATVTTFYLSQTYPTILFVQNGTTINATHQVPSQGFESSFVNSLYDRGARVVTMTVSLGSTTDARVFMANVNAGRVPGYSNATTESGSSVIAGGDDSPVTASPDEGSSILGPIIGGVVGGVVLIGVVVAGVLIWKYKCNGNKGVRVEEQQQQQEQHKQDTDGVLMHPVQPAPYDIYQHQNTNYPAPTAWA